MVEFTHQILLIAEANEDLAAESGSSLTGGGQGLLFALGLLLMISLLTRSMIRAYQRIRKRSPKKDVKRIRTDADRAMPRQDLPLIDAPASYGRWHAEMNDIARSVEAEIETKLRRLQATIRLANETSQRLENAISKANQVTCLTSANDSQMDHPSPHVQESTGSSSEIERGSISETPVPASIDSQINELAKANASAQEIAAQLGLALGDVELIMSTQPPRPT